jgi:proteasome assembly chaperone (PAC2) family protein
VSPARISERLVEAIAQLDETHGYILHPIDAAAIARVATDLADLKLAIEMAQLRRTAA